MPGRRRARPLNVGQFFGRANSAGVSVGCLGLHFSLDVDQVAALRALDEDDRVKFVQEQFEEELWSADKSRIQETDKAWDAIHRSLTDGALAWDNGSYPLNHVILGGELLYRESDYILSLKSADEVRDIADALGSVTRERLRAGYNSIEADACGYRVGDDDFEYTWSWFKSLVDFYKRAAAAGHAVLFTADQ
jgi:hypothetical protein